MKKSTIALFLAVVMVITLSTPYVGALEEIGSQSSDETVILDLSTPDGNIKVTYTEGNDGVLFMYEYHDDVFYEMTRYTPGNTFFERSFASPSTRASIEWEVVDFSDSIMNDVSTLAVKGKTTRNLGYMHYKNPITGDILSISCYVDEWYNPGKTVSISGTLGSIVEFTTFLVGAIGIPVGIAGNVVTSLLSAAVVLLVGSYVKAAVATDVTANVTDQRIYGNSTSHSGKPRGDLGNASITYVTSKSSKYSGQYFYEGFTTHDWGTANLGRWMFYKVFGVEYVPSYWTGL